MTRFLLVCAGGAIGSGARYLLTLWLARLAGVSFPWGTLLANIIGCFALALIAELTTLSAEVRLALMTGVLGGFKDVLVLGHVYGNAALLEGNFVGLRHVAS